MNIKSLTVAAVAVAALALADAPVALAQTASKPAVKAPAAPAMTSEMAAIRKLVEQRVPGMEVRSITSTGIAGLYEVLADDRIVYVDPQVNYLIMGSIYDLASKQNLTDDRYRKLNRIAFDSLPFDQSFKRVRGDGSRRVAMFSDADCPFCARIEKELGGMTNVTIYTFPFPIDSLHPSSALKSRQIWCAADRGKAWDEWFNSQKLPDNKGDCANPVAANQALGEKLHISATPTLVFADGSVVPGALPLAQLEQMLAKAESDARVGATR
ncbi:MAG: DsbC family protein [Betaproteobacteria bacterium]